MYQPNYDIRLIHIVDLFDLQMNLINNSSLTYRIRSDAYGEL